MSPKEGKGEVWEKQALGGKEFPGFARAPQLSLHSSFTPDSVGLDLHLSQACMDILGLLLLPCLLQLFFLSPTPPLTAPSQVLCSSHQTMLRFLTFYLFDLLLDFKLSFHHFHYD